MVRQLGLWPATMLLLLMFGLSLVGLRQDAPTFDEQGFLVRGLAYLRGENRHMRVGHPLGLNALNAGLLVYDDGVLLPTEDPSWQETSFHRPAELFLWEIGNDVDHVMFLARLPTVWLGLLLAALVGRWAVKMGGRSRAGLLSLALIALDPNILAHARLTTTDLGLAAGAALAGYTLWRFLKGPSAAGALLAGVGLGLLLNTKFTALLYLPLCAVVVLVRLLAGWREQRLFPTRPALFLLTLYPIAALVTLWAGNGFQVGPVSNASLSPVPLPTGLNLPLAHYLEQLLDIGGRVQTATVSFLLGEVSESGWWYYFPVTFLLKTPLPTLLLLVWATLRLLRGLWLPGVAPVERITGATALLVPAGGFFLIALTTDINIGYRLLLSILPFLYVFAGVAVLGRPAQQPAGTVSRRSLVVAAPALLILWLLGLSLWIYPHFLAYFNILAGGPANGWKSLVDSNLDWGQDLARLAAWQEQHDSGPLRLSYFGEARPAHYGLDYIGLDSFPPRLMNPEADPFYPPQPGPGVYAISATNLQGVLFADHDQFAWFRDQELLDRIGYSIFLYEVPPTGPPAFLSLGGPRLNQVAPADFAALQTNDVTPGWFDPGSSLLISGGRPAWLALRPGEAAFSDILSQLASPVETGATYTLFRLHDDAEPTLAAILSGWSSAEPTRLTLDEREIALLGAQEAKIVPAGPGERGLTLATAWRMNGSAGPVKIFLHLLNEEGEIVSQWDGLGGPWEGWRSGDTLLQRHELSLPADVAPGSYRLLAGLYEPESGVRWLSEVGADHVLLQEIELP